MKKSPKERFWEKVNCFDDPDACWIWRAGTDSNGYGAFRVNETMYRAHRYSYLLRYGFIPTGKEICHRCNNRLCVNPFHLYAGTRSENTLDSIKVGTHAGIKNFKGIRSQGRRGEDCLWAKLTDRIVREIRQRSKNGESCTSIGRIYGIRRGRVSEIINKKRWKHVLDEDDSLGVCEGHA